MMSLGQMQVEGELGVDDLDQLDDLLDHASDPPRTVMTVTVPADPVTSRAADKFGGVVIHVPALRQ